MKKDLQLILAFLVIIVAFALIMIGIYCSEMLICKAALVPLFGALLYTPLKNRVLVKRKGSKSE